MAYNIRDTCYSPHVAILKKRDRSSSTVCVCLDEKWRRQKRQMAMHSNCFCAPVCNNATGFTWHILWHQISWRKYNQHLGPFFAREISIRGKCIEGGSQTFLLTREARIQWNNCGWCMKFLTFYGCSFFAYDHRCWWCVTKTKWISLGELD